MTTMESTACFGADEVAVTFPTSQYGGAARSIAFYAPIQLSEDDLVAALWVATSNGSTVEELANLAAVRTWVADAIVNVGLEEIDEARHVVADLVPGTEDHAWLQEVQGAVRRAFSSVLPGPARRTLVGAA